MTPTITTDGAAGTSGAAEGTEPKAKRPKPTGLAKIPYVLWAKRRKHRQLAGVGVILLLTGFGNPTSAGWIAGAVVVSLAMLVRLWASGVVVKNELLATTGPYGFVRHPLYVGNTLLGGGFCIASGLWWSWLVFLGVMFYFYPYTIRYEDKKLHRLFGEPWARWAAETRALLPRLTPYVDKEATDAPRTGWSLRLSMARNGEPIHILVGVICLWYLHAQMGLG